MTRAIQTLLAAALLSLGTSTFGQAYPTKPVRMVVPFAAGGSVDVGGRLLAAALSESLQQQFIVENRSGAGGMIAGEFVARSAPDGYTLYVASTGSTILAPLMFPKPLWQWDKVFAPVSSYAFQPVVLHVNPALPIRNVQDLVAYAKARPGKVTVATGGAGSVNHVSSELLQLSAKIRWEHIHHKGNAPAIVDVMGGHIDVLFSQVSATVQHIQRGQLRALATTGAERLRSLPDVPTMQEAGFKDFEAVTFHGVFAPIDTPRAVVSQLSAAIQKVMKDPALLQKFETIGTEPRASTPEQFTKFLQVDTERWRRVVTEANLKSE
jgi:tripartite-type tricarboxylate transporter receptor subunit TctC